MLLLRRVRVLTRTHIGALLAEPPIALCEVQGYAYAAKRAGALLARALNEPELAGELDAAAETLRSNFEEAFWCEEFGTYALALDGEKKQCRVRASNAGHALFCKIASQQHANATARSLMSEHSFCGWGVRTIAACEARYNPMSYHDGSVWPHDNALIALGFSYYGLQDDVAKILDGLHEASQHVELHRLPELSAVSTRGRRPTARRSTPSLAPLRRGQRAQSTC
jgi:glycogen debranching enzyme